MNRAGQTTNANLAGDSLPHQFGAACSLTYKKQRWPEQSHILPKNKVSLKMKKTLISMFGTKRDHVQLSPQSRTLNYWLRAAELKRTWRHHARAPPTQTRFHNHSSLKSRDESRWISMVDNGWAGEGIYRNGGPTSRFNVWTHRQLK